MHQIKCNLLIPLFHKLSAVPSCTSQRKNRGRPAERGAYYRKGLRQRSALAPCPACLHVRPTGQATRKGRACETGEAGTNWTHDNPHQSKPGTPMTCALLEKLQLCVLELHTHGPGLREVKRKLGKRPAEPRCPGVCPVPARQAGRDAGKSSVQACPGLSSPKRAQLLPCLLPDLGHNVSHSPCRPGA